MSDFDTWERNNFHSLLHIRKIVIEGFLRENPDLEQILKSVDFFQDLNILLYDRSRTVDLSEGQEMDENTRKIYYEYCGKIMSST
jgi:hypothetical protein